MVFPPSRAELSQGRAGNQNGRVEFGDIPVTECGAECGAAAFGTADPKVGPALGSTRDSAPRERSWGGALALGTRGNQGRALGPSQGTAAREEATGNLFQPFVS